MSGIYSASRRDASRSAAILRGPGRQRKRNTPQVGGWLEIRTRYRNYFPEYSELGNPLVPMAFHRDFFCDIVTAENSETTPRMTVLAALPLPLQR